MYLFFILSIYTSNPSATKGLNNQDEQDTHQKMEEFKKNNRIVFVPYVKNMELLHSSFEDGELNSFRCLFNYLKGIEDNFYRQMEKEEANALLDKNERTITSEIVSKLENVFIGEAVKDENQVFYGENSYRVDKPVSSECGCTNKYENGGIVDENTNSSELLVY